MSKEITLEIYIDGNELHHYNKISIEQRFHDHHSFRIVLDHDALENTRSYTLDTSQHFLGKFLTINFGNSDATDNVFKGIITQVSLEQEHGLWGSMVLKGYSPTYLMESGAHFASYEKRTLQEILEESTKGLASNDMKINNNPNFKNRLGYTCQYGESYFHFINRLATQYGEWLFYDGSTLHFGKPKSADKIKLTYGQHITAMSMELNLVPANISHFSYNSKNDELLTTKLPAGIDGAGSITQYATKISNELFRDTISQPVPVRTSNKEELERFAKNQKAKITADTVKMRGRSNSAKVKLGSILEINIANTETISSSTRDHGEYLVIALTHEISGTGIYSNSFECIPASNEFVPDKIPNPVATSQMATVKDNNDPDGGGRVRVQMLWQQEKGQLTDWIRVLTPDAGGGGEKVSKNRGFVFIPEVGDQVIVGFRYNDPNRPFVQGSMFHGKTGGGGSADNSSKSLTTRSGSSIQVNDASHTVIMQTSNGNSIKVDEKSGAVTISTASTVTINSGSNVNINSKTINLAGSESISIMSPSISVGTLGGENPTENITVEAKSVSFEGEDEISNISKSITINASESLNEFGGKYLLQVSEAMVDGGSKIVMSSDKTDIA